MERRRRSNRRLRRPDLGMAPSGMAPSGMGGNGGGATATVEPSSATPVPSTGGSGAGATATVEPSSAIPTPSGRTTAPSATGKCDGERCRCRRRERLRAARGDRGVGCRRCSNASGSAATNSSAGLWTATGPRSSAATPDVGRFSATDPVATIVSAPAAKSVNSACRCARVAPMRSRRSPSTVVSVVPRCSASAEMSSPRSVRRRSRC